MAQGPTKKSAGKGMGAAKPRLLHRPTLTENDINTTFTKQKIYTQRDASELTASLFAIIRTRRLLANYRKHSKTYSQSCPRMFLPLF